VVWVRTAVSALTKYLAYERGIRPVALFALCYSIPVLVESLSPRVFLLKDWALIAALWVACTCLFLSLFGPGGKKIR
jgi:hypothetical protein